MKNLLKLILALTLVFTTNEVIGQTSLPFSEIECENNLIENWSFIDGNIPGSMPSGSVARWSSVRRSPDVRLINGNGDNGFIGMWGNERMGEGIQQLLNADLEAGHSYQISLSVKNGNDPSKTDYTKIKMRASNSLQSSRVCTGDCELIGISDRVTDFTSWTTITYPVFVATNNYNRITINVTNDENGTDNSDMSYGMIDKVCIVEILPCNIVLKETLPKETCTNKTLDVSWSGGIDGQTNINLRYQDGSIAQTFATNTSGNGTSTFTINEISNLDWCGKQFYIEISDGLNLNCSDSSRLFTIKCCQDNYINECKGNLVKNWSFESLSYWSNAYGSPDHSLSNGCGDNGRIGMWGNQVVGEGVKQVLTNSFEIGHTYQISMCVKHGNDPSKQNYSKFQIRASNSNLNSTSCNNGCEIIGTSNSITEFNYWSTINFNYTPSDNYNTITLSVTNDLAINNGRKVSYGLIDKICIVDVTPCNIKIKNNLPERICTNKTVDLSWTGGINGQTNIVLRYHDGSLAQTLASNTNGSGTNSFTINDFTNPEWCGKKFYIEVYDTFNSECKIRSNGFIIECCNCKCGKWTNSDIWYSILHKASDYKQPKQKNRFTKPERRGMKISCKDRINVGLGGELRATFSKYICESSNECKAEYIWQVEDLNNQTIVSNGTGRSVAYQFNLPGDFAVKMIPKCGEKVCDPCIIYVHVDPKDEKCECGDWENLNGTIERKYKASINGGLGRLNIPKPQVKQKKSKRNKAIKPSKVPFTCGEIIEAKVNTNFEIIAPVYQCNPKSCDDNYGWVINRLSNGPRFKAPSGRGRKANYTFSSPGVYKLTFQPFCGNNRCKPCEIKFKISEK